MKPQTDRFIQLSGQKTELVTRFIEKAKAGEKATIADVIRVLAALNYMIGSLETLMVASIEKGDEVDDVKERLLVLRKAKDAIEGVILQINP